MRGQRRPKRHQHAHSRNACPRPPRPRVGWGRCMPDRRSALRAPVRRGAQVVAAEGAEAGASAPAAQGAPPHPQQQPQRRRRHQQHHHGPVGQSYAGRPLVKARVPEMTQVQLKALPVPGWRRAIVSPRMGCGVHCYRGGCAQPELVRCVIAPALLGIGREDREDICPCPKASVAPSEPNVARCSLPRASLLQDAGPLADDVQGRVFAVAAPPAQNQKRREGEAQRRQVRQPPTPEDRRQQDANARRQRQDPPAIRQRVAGLRPDIAPRVEPLRLLDLTRRQGRERDQGHQRQRASAPDAVDHHRSRRASGACRWRPTRLQNTAIHGFSAPAARRGDTFTGIAVPHSGQRSVEGADRSRSEHTDQREGAESASGELGTQSTARGVSATTWRQTNGARLRPCCSSDAPRSRAPCSGSARTRASTRPDRRDYCPGPDGRDKPTLPGMSTTAGGSRDCTSRLLGPTSFCLGPAKK